MNTAHSVIAAVRNKNDFELALASDLAVIYLLSAHILELPTYIEKANKAGKKLFLHMDMMEGLGKDSAALEYVAQLHAYGIISTRATVIKQAKALGLCTVQRFFIVDGKSVSTALETLHNTKPVFAELMPGVAFKAVKLFADAGFHNIIAGGLITRESEVLSAFEAGAVAVSTSAQSIWNMSF